jgi:glutamate-1-semialdehyde 2,1-aminomutase
MPWIALSYRHGEEELAATERALDRTFAVLRRALSDSVEKYVEGPIIKPVFRKYN